jgi:ATP-binding cassette subfamily B protein
MNMFQLYARVLRLLGPDQRLGWLLALGNLALAVVQFAEPILFGRIVDALSAAPRGGTPDPWATVIPLILTWVSLGLFIIVCGVLVSLYADRLSHRRRQAVLTDYFEHVIQLPLTYHGGTHSGRLMKVMLSGTDTLWALWLAFFREHLAAFVSLLVLLPVTLFINWRLATIIIVLSVVFAAVTFFVMHKSEAKQRSVEEHYSDLAERASDTLGNVALVQSFARIETEISGLKNVVARLLGAQMPVLSWWAVATVLTRSATTIAMLAILIVGSWLYFQGLSTVGEIVSFMSIATLVIGRLEQAIGFANRIFMDAPRLRDFFGVLDTEPAVRDRPDAVDPGRVRGLVEFQDVSFSYDGKRPAVADVTFTVLPGETIALVGSTGAGKSTALALLHRVFDPQSGVVKIDGMDIRSLTLTSLRRNIGVVFQEALLFNRSIADNLRVGKSDATDDELRDAAARAQALDFIERTPDGLDARVGERGRMLSGGERQRLAIARALLKDPPILILDEATSALDTVTEAKVQAALDAVMNGRTTFVIAHRLSTVRNANRILVFEGGRVVEAGTFDELVRLGGYFAEMARTQFTVPEGAGAGAGGGSGGPIAET